MNTELDMLIATANAATDEGSMKPILGVYAKDSSGKNTLTDIPLESLVGTRVSIIKSDDTSVNCIFTQKMCDAYSPLVGKVGEQTLFRVFIKG